ncbi:MAG: efflux RND transporter periplasmic adaptor subunit [Candidatus Nitrosotenuis sp.]
MKRLISGIVLLIIVVLLIGLFVRHRPAKVDYRTVRVERGEILSIVSATGTLSAVDTVEVGSQVSGTIQKIFVDFNSIVKKGQIIAQIDPSLFNARVKETEGSYNNAVANLEKAKEELTDARRTVARYRQLFQEGVISQADLDSAETKYQQAVASVKGAEGSVTQNLGLYEQAKTNLRYSTITSPIDGIVISRNVDEGQTVAASFQTPTLFTIAKDLTKMEIHTSVDEADISKVRLGQLVTFTVDSYPDEIFKGLVSEIRKSPVIVQNVVTYTVIVTVENKDLKLLPGMTANVYIETMRKKDVLKIPSSALRFSPESEIRVQRISEDGAKIGMTEKVYVIRNGKVFLIPLKTGVEGEDGYTEVLSSGGLKEGDEVIVEELTEKKKEVGIETGAKGPTVF